MSAVLSIPADPALPHLRALVDAERMAGVLAQTLAPGVPEPAVRVRYLRYRPGKSLLVGYEVEVGDSSHEAFALADAKRDLAARAEAPESAALAGKVAGRTPAATPLAYAPEVEALVQWLPLDLALPAMAEPPEVLRERLATAGLELDAGDLPRTVKHKPTTRGVVRVDEHFVKAYPDEDSFAESVHALDASEPLPFPTARRTAVLPELLMVAQSRVQGERPEGPIEAAPEAGALLAALHATPVADDLPAELPRDQLKSAGKQAELVSRLVPQLEPRLQALVRRLEAEIPSDNLVTSHGGFHISQLLRSDGELGVVDFDGMCRSPAASDIASYVASVVERPEDLPAAAETLALLVDAYGRRPPGVRWYLAANLLGRARRPFARVQPDWPEKVEERVAAVEAAFDLER